MLNFGKAGLFTIQPKQLEFASKCRECDVDGGPTSVMIGGGRGSSKSFAAFAQVFADDCQRCPNLKVLYLRKVGRANKEQIADMRKTVLFAIPHEYLEQKAVIHLPNGSQVILGNFKDEKDIDKYLGLEYSIIVIEEANQLSFSKIKNILSCLRTSNPNWRPRAYFLTNPGGVSHAENKKIFVEPWREKKEKETRYIHSTVHDNRFVNKEYLTYLESLTGWKRKSWLEGSWDFQAGSFFTNFVPEVHMIERPPVHEAVNWFAGFDYGRVHPTAFTLSFQAKSGIFYVQEAFQQAQTNIEEIADHIRWLLKKYNLTPRNLDYIYAGRDCFSRNEKGITIATQYEDCGINLIPADIDRINGWSRLHQLFGDIERNIKPKLYLNKASCGELAAQISSAQCDEKRPQDVEKFDADPETAEGGDDLLDCLRYAYCGNPSVALEWAKPIGVGSYNSVGF